ncbi:MAG: LacI family DNA-binding transcriptional regulator [Verrucomicrobiota bacterium JB024]|nr:LacI family DNA-binding transcriptional regulator [Verrucomicrobiota bacterium JB024]
MTDIASEVGCSLMTVSRALRGAPRVADSTRQHIIATAIKLGYRPDPEVSRLMGHLRLNRTAQPETIAWITSESTRDGWQDSPAYTELYTGAQAHAHSIGFQLQPYWLKEKNMTAKRLGSILRNRGIRGVIVGPQPQSCTVIPNLGWEHFAAATCGFSLQEPRLHRACSQQYQALSLAWDELRKRGYRRIGFALSVESNLRTEGMWLSSFLARQSTPSPTRFDIIPPLVLEQWDDRRFLAWFHQHRPDALIGWSDAAELLRKNGIPIPQTCAYALINTAGLASPAAGVNHHMDALGAAAVDLVAEQLHHHRYGLPAIPKIVMVECSWSDGPDVPRRLEHKPGRRRTGK